VTGNASRTLKSERQLAPGQVLDDTGDTYSAPPWKMQGAVFWGRGPLSLSGTVNYLGGFKSNRAGTNFRATGDPAPAVRKFDVRGGYEFKEGVWRGRGKGVRVNVGVSNVFDAKPPFYDVIYGYNAALHSDYLWGRTYEFSFALPF
jgi:outer membrane receptor protein involved in Fe transport